MNDITWEQIKKLEFIKLYAGNHPVSFPATASPNYDYPKYVDFIGLSLNRNDDKHILQDVTKSIPLEDNTVDIFVSEDVFEHIYYDKLQLVIDEIYRILKPCSLFRLAMPDYGCDILWNRSVKNKENKIVFDPGGGSPLIHVWFPRIDIVTQLLAKTKFYTNGKIEFLHYYKMDGSFVMNQIDHSKAPILRTPDFDERVQNPHRPMSLVVDLMKEE